MTGSDPVAVVLARLDGVKQVGDDKWTAHCPAHDDRSPSLSVGIGNDGKAVIFCHAGCSTTAIVEALGLTLAALFPDDRPKQARSQFRSRGREVAAYDYRDEAGDLLYQNVRYEPKHFACRRPDGRGGWVYKKALDGIQRVPFHYPELLAAPPDSLIVMTEGEKDALALAALGFTVTCHKSVGSGGWPSEWAPAIERKHIVICADDDPAGRKYAEQAVREMHGVAASVRVLNLPGLPEGGDASAWLDAGGTAEELRALIDATPVWEPRAAPETDLRNSFQAREPIQRDAWPVLQPEARHGLAGEIVATLEPETEADSALILLTTLVWTGNAAGRSPHTFVGESRHGTNLFVAGVGKSSRSRKGSSKDGLDRLFRQADSSSWIPTPTNTGRFIDGLGSGEAIIWAIRDSTSKTDKDGKTVLDDPGVTDKRLMVQEEELSTILKVSGREGSIISATIRKSYDSPLVLHNAVKRAPIQASGPHISIVGHVTLEELRRALTETDKANGFGNRFLWAIVRRSKAIASPRRLPDSAITPLAHQLRAALTAARKAGEITRDEAAERLWNLVYEPLTTDFPGIFGSIVARAEAHAVRLSLVYAVLDQSDTVTPVHLTAALAVVAYAEASARHIFGDRTGDPVADRIMDTLLNSGELSETGIHDLFHRNEKAARIGQALQLLLRHGLVRVEERAPEHGGKPARYWAAVRKATVTDVPEYLAIARAFLQNELHEFNEERPHEAEQSSLNSSTSYPSAAHRGGVNGARPDRSPSAEPPTAVVWACARCGASQAEHLQPDSCFQCGAERTGEVA
jgi:hypothetical protein